MFWVSQIRTQERKLEFFIGGRDVLGKVRLGLWEQFQFSGEGEGGVLEPNSRTGVF